MTLYSTIQKMRFVGREVLGPRTLLRQNEPDLVMDNKTQVKVFIESGLVSPTMSASNLFHLAKMSQTISGCKKVLDLGCGPAVLLSQIAALHPEIEFIGIDLSAEMLVSAEAILNENNPNNNVTLQQGDITKLSHFSDQSVDGIISTMALHHLPSYAHVEQCFAEMGRILKPDGALYISDLTRLKSEKSISFFLEMQGDKVHPVFKEDYKNSIIASYLPKDFKNLTKQYLPSQIKVFTPAIVPFLAVIKSPDKSLSSQLQTYFKTHVDNLNPEQKKVLNDLLFFLKLNGMGNNPF